MRGRLGYSREIADRICAELDRGRPLRAICSDPGMPGYTTVKRWARSNRDGFGVRTQNLRKRGRPTRYSSEIADAISTHLCDGRSLSEICRDPDMPDLKTVCRWMRSNRCGFGDLYRRARMVGYFTMMDEMREIADDNSNDLIERRMPNGEIEIVFNWDNLAWTRERLKLWRQRIANAMPKDGHDWLSLEPRPARPGTARK